MKKNWKLVIDDETFEILRDEETDENCYDYWCTCERGHGRGSISTTREMCFKKIIRIYKKEIEEKQKEVNRLKRNFRKLEDKYEIE